MIDTLSMKFNHNGKISSVIIYVQKFVADCSTYNIGSVGTSGDYDPAWVRKVLGELFIKGGDGNFKKFVASYTVSSSTGDFMKTMGESSRIKTLNWLGNRDFYIGLFTVEESDLNQEFPDVQFTVSYRGKEVYV